MLLALALALQDGPTAADAEVEMAAAAQTEGHWTAVRRFAAEDAIVLTPEPKSATEVLGPREDPEVAYRWRPAISFVSCDGTAAVNTGPWERLGRHGYFTTAWKRTGGEWKWVLDSGNGLDAPAHYPEDTETRVASCAFQRSANPAFPEMAAPESERHGKSADGTLLWDWKPEADGRWSLTVRLWNGHSLDTVLHELQY